jgi:hypothetical protein
MQQPNEKKVFSFKDISDSNDKILLICSMNRN